jgi:hypothetical protein
MEKRAVSVLQVLQRLPASLSIAVLASSRLRLDQHLSILPASPHLLAVKAELPYILNNRSLTFDFDFTAGKHSCTPCALLLAATKAVPALEKLDLQNIPANINKCLLKLIAAACTSASDVSLSCRSIHVKHSSQPQTFARLTDAQFQ